MVGDSPEKDVKGTEAAGIDVVLLDRENMAAYENKISNLTSLEELITKTSGFN